jgi:hypothetical protein
LKPWIGVDLDGTLAEYHGWNDGAIGAPVPAMLERVKGWLAEGKEVKILTARVAGADWLIQTKLVREWCKTHIGQELPVTCMKDFGMVELWDDRAVQVVPNQGVRVDGRP